MTKLTEGEMSIPVDSKEFAANMANYRYWDNKT